MKYRKAFVRLAPATVIISAIWSVGWIFEGKPWYLFAVAYALVLAVWTGGAFFLTKASNAPSSETKNHGDRDS